MSLTTRLCSCNSLVGNAAFLRPRINIHLNCQKSQDLPKHLYTSAILSLHKDTKPGRVKRNVVAVSQKVGLVLVYKVTPFLILGCHNAQDWGEDDDS